MTSSARRFPLALGVLGAVLALHFLWFARFGPRTGWVRLDDASAPSPLRAYLETQDVWLGLTYAASFAFAAVTLRRHREERFCSATTLSVGGVTLTGFLAVAGCYLIGCCGSPMLAVYLSLFGAKFLPFAKPLVFAVTLLLLGATWGWTDRRRRRAAALPAASCERSGAVGSMDPRR